MALKKPPCPSTACLGRAGEACWEPSRAVPGPAKPCRGGAGPPRQAPAPGGAERGRRQPWRCGAAGAGRCGARPCTAAAAAGGGTAGMVPARRSTAPCGRPSGRYRGRRGDGRGRGHLRTELPPSPGRAEASPAERPGARLPPAGGTEGREEGREKGREGRPGHGAAARDGTWGPRAPAAVFGNAERQGGVCRGVLRGVKVSLVVGLRHGSREKEAQGEWELNAKCCPASGGGTGELCAHQ